jgi:hypothetical protein
MAGQLMAQLPSSWQEDSPRAEHEGSQAHAADALGCLGEVPDTQVLPPLSSRGQKVRRKFAVAMLYRPALLRP